MPIKHLLVIYFIQLLLVWLPSFGIAGLFKKAGRRDIWKAYVPFLNTWEMQKMSGRKMHWVFWQFIPIVGWFITPGIFIEFVKLFGRYSFLDHTGASLVSPFYMPYIGNSKNVRYIGKEMVKKHKKGTAREWLDAAVFAVVAATLIRLFVFEAYVIPTGSMEKTLLVNDYLFVSKMSYGPRVPNTPLSFPFVHHTMPLTGGKSYSELIKLPYIRWWGQPVKRNDIVVFNFPANDTTTLPDDSKDPYYDKIVKEQFRLALQSKRTLDEVYAEARQSVIDNNKIVVRPVDKQENYVKRCVGVGGDIIEIKDGILWVNGQVAYKDPNSEIRHIVKTSKAMAQSDFEELGVKFYEGDYSPVSSTEFLLNISWAELEKLKTVPGLTSAISLDTTYIDDIYGNTEEAFADKLVFPRTNDPKFKWTRDKFGPLQLPKKGWKIDLTKENMILYRKAIESYEKNIIEEKNGQYYVNGNTSYTFKMDYYWMMGDNRHNSQDSRYWGYVPEDHIVGKPKLIWMSWEKGPRWKRIFSLIK